MPQSATAGEVAQIVLKAEEIGVGLYRVLAEVASDDQARDMFEWIGEDEGKDIRLLERLSDALDGQLPEGIDPEDYRKYLSILRETSIFRDEDTCHELARNAWDAEEAAGLACIFEREVILFLHELRRSVPDTERAVVDRLLDGEYKHLRLLHALALCEQPSQERQP